MALAQTGVLCLGMDKDIENLDDDNERVPYGYHEGRYIGPHEQKEPEPVPSVARDPTPHEDLNRTQNVTKDFNGSRENSSLEDEKKKAILRAIKKVKNKRLHRDRNNDWGRER